MIISLSECSGHQSKNAGENKKFFVHFANPFEIASKMISFTAYILLTSQKKRDLTKFKKNSSVPHTGW